MKPGILYGGNYGSFSWKAVELAQAQNSELRGLPPIESLDPPTAIKRFWNREYSHAVIPVFNPTLGGPIPSAKSGFLEAGCPLPPEGTPLNEWVDVFIKLHQDEIFGEPLYLPIEFSIHALPGVKPENITRLVAYSMAVDQCRKGIQRVVGRAFEEVPYSDTGKAAQDLSKFGADPAYKIQEPESALLEPLSHTAILGPAWCDKLFGLQTLWGGVQDLPGGNVTTFIVFRNLSSLGISESSAMDVLENCGPLAGSLTAMGRFLINTTLMKFFVRIFYFCLFRSAVLKQCVNASQKKFLKRL
ncbi:MAG: prephenate dehydratase domain-containing protein [Candidatus Gracilibacteria bacterium]